MNTLKLPLLRSDYPIHMPGMKSFFFSYLLSALLISCVCCKTQQLTHRRPSKHFGHVDECNALLQFKNSLTINKRISNSACVEYGLHDLSSLGTTSWKEGSDCCTNWDGIKCDNVTGNVFAVDLTCSCLEGNLHSNSSIFSLRHLANISLGGNHLTGPIPSSICRVSSLQYLDLSYNDLNGTILPCLGNLTNFQAYGVGGNRFTGEIPSSLCNITSLFALDMSDNSLSGEIPKCLGNSTNLEILNLSNNSFRGLLPEITAPNNCNLKFVVLSKNHLKGKLPPSWAFCKNLVVLDLTGNELRGSFPVWLGALQNLSILILRSNKFYGQITLDQRAVHPFPKLQILDISNNNFNGTLKYISNVNGMMGRNRAGVSQYDIHNNISLVEWATLIYKGVEMVVRDIQKALLIIDLSYNHFQDEIPKDIGNLQLLKGFNLSHNNLRGVIPSSLGNLTNIEWLDLSSNNFSGEIPAALTSLTSLAVFNVSMNHFTGEVPRGKQFDTFLNDSYRGNPGLCGPPLSKACTEEHHSAHPSEPENEDDTDRWMSGWRSVLMGYGTGTVIGISIGCIFIEIRRPPMWLVKMFKRWQNKKSENATRVR